MRHGASIIACKADVFLWKAVKVRNDEADADYGNDDGDSASFDALMFASTTRSLLSRSLWAVFSIIQPF